MKAHTYKSSIVVTRPCKDSQGQAHFEGLVICSGSTFIVRRVSGRDEQCALSKARDLIENLEDNLAREAAHDLDTGETLAAFSTSLIPAEGVPFIVVNHPPATEIMQRNGISTILQ